MSGTQLRNFQMLIGLFRQLKAFGLNPAEWTLERSGEPQVTRLSLRHKNDSDFRLNAQVVRETSRINLESLSIASI